MKRFLIITVCILSVTSLFFAMAAGIAEEKPRYIVDVPDEITVGKDHIVYIPYLRIGSMLNFMCSEPSAYMYGGTSGSTQEGDYFRETPCMYFRQYGIYTLTMSNPEKTFTRDITVNVVEGATGITVAREHFVIQVGETADLGVSFEGGIFWGAPRTNYTTIGEYTPDGRSFTALQAGFMNGQLSIGTASVSFDILAVDPCEGISLSTGDEYGSVGTGVRMITKDRNGKTVCAQIEITEGAELVNVTRNGTDYFVYPTAPGYVTFTAYGTDGSTDTLRWRIFPAPDSMTVELSSDTLAAGEEARVRVALPEGTWYPVHYDLSRHQPKEDTLQGPVATVSKDGVITALLPGTCSLYISGGPNLGETRTLTVTEGDGGLVFDYPKEGFNCQEPYQLSVFRNGHPVSAVFSTTFPYIAVSADGVLTAEMAGVTGKVNARLEDGSEYSFGVKSVYMPSWLKPEAEGMAIPLNMQTDICTILSDVPLTPVYDLILCSDNEAVLKTDGMRLLPQSTGEALVTVWSRYCDTACLLPVIVTEPTDMLYVNGMHDGVSLDVPYNTNKTYTVPLPTVTDFYGNPVKVTWTITEQKAGSGTTKKECVALTTVNSVRSLKASWGNGYAYLTATSESGATLRLTAWPYFRADNIAFRETDAMLSVGQRTQLNITYNSGSNGASLMSGDITYTLSGDTSCVLVEPHFSYYILTALKPGTVTLTAKLYNGKSASVRVTVTAAECCANGHDPAWRTVSSATPDRNGRREKYCSRCNVPLGEEVIPCTGTLNLEKREYYVKLTEEMTVIDLGINLDGDRKRSFTCVSSDPSVAVPLAGAAVCLKPGVAVLTVSTGDCTPVSCTLHVADHDTLILPAGLTRVEESAFENDTSITHIVIPEGAEAIGSRAFAGCTCLKEIVIPASVSTIASDAFEGCGELTIRCVPGSAAAAFAAKHGIPTEE